MNGLNFNEDDKKKFIEFLNIVAKNAVFTMKTDEIVSYFKLLAHMQNSMLPKLEANILEIVRVMETPPEEAKKEPTKKSK